MIITYFEGCISKNDMGSKYLLAIHNNMIIGYRKMTKHTYEWDLQTPILGEYWPAYKLRNLNNGFKYLDRDFVPIFHIVLKPKIKLRDMVCLEHTNEKNLAMAEPYVMVDL